MGWDGFGWVGKILAALEHACLTRPIFFLGWEMNENDISMFVLQCSAHTDIYIVGDTGTV